MDAQFPVFNRLKACRYGQMIYNVHDSYIGRSLDLYGEFSEGEIEVFRQMVQPGQVVVEVGANIGAHTVFFSRQVGPNGFVLAFEPQRIVFQTLCANAALNQLTNIDCRQQAIGKQPGEIMVPAIDYNQEGNFGGLELGKWTQGERVGVITLDSLSLARCHLLKIDVEGMELDVLLGAAATIARLRPLLYVENDRRDRAVELVRYIDSLDYSMYWHVPPLFNPQNFASNTNNVFGNICSMNMLCVHKSIPQKLDGFQPVEVPV